MNRYTVSSLIGEGSFGRVYKATRKDDTQVVAIKIISKRGRSPRDLRSLRRECDIQAQLKHPNVIEMLESFETRSELVVVTEFAMIDLHRYMSLHGAFCESAARSLVSHLVSALYYLHSHRILHRDLKPQNVLLNDDMQAKLCDFGLARNMTTRTHVLTSIKGTPLYMAPELLAERPYDHLADLWSLGCIAYESMAGQPPFCTTSILHLVKMIKHEEIKWPSDLTSDCRSFLQGLLEKDPTLRASWAQLLCHPFVEGKLFVTGIKADNSPFTNPQAQQQKKFKTSDTRTMSNKIDMLISNTNLLSIEANGENVSSSRDSINAIPPSDIENIETDLEDNINPVEVPFADSMSSSSRAPSTANNKFAPAFTKLAAEAGGIGGGDDVGGGVMIPMINSQTCFVSGNNNMVLLNFNDNFEMNSHRSISASANDADVNNLKHLRNKDLERRKLSQNLDNFSLRLGQSIDAENHRKCALEHREKEEQTGKESKTHATLKSPTQSTDEKQSSYNSPPCLLPGWDSCDEMQSPPIENDEWLAFLHRSMQEILDGEWDSLKQQNLVSIIVAPLRNSKAIPKVINSVAKLLSMPFALNESNSLMDAIKSVYIEVKLVPNLMYASKLLMCQTSDASASGPQTLVQRAMRPLNGLNDEELSTASHLYELVCHLVHLRQQFLSQFCDAVAILAANDLLINFLNHDFKNVHAVRISCCVLALFCCVLRELPENAELVEKVIFNAKLNVVALLENANDLLRTRMCMLLRLLTRFSLRGLQAIWGRNMKCAIENLTNDHNDEVRELAESTLQELRQFAFYA